MVSAPPQGGLAPAPGETIYEGTIEAGQEVVVVSVYFRVAWDPPSCAAE